MLDDTLYDAFGQRQISTMFTQLNQYRVVLETTPGFHQTPQDLTSIFLRSAAGGSVPLAAFTRVEERSTPLAVNHQGQFPVVTVSFNLAPGASLGAAVKAVDQAKDDLHMPESVQASFQGTASSFQGSLSNTPLLILAAVITVYILLGVLYESYIHPLTILSTLPSAGVGALLALLICGSEFSIIALIGIILLIGIVEKNAIMMIDFALDAERKDRKEPHDAIYQAALLRFRPIIMTTMAALLGAVPLALGRGDRRRAPAAARHRDHRRPDLQPAPHPLHHAGGLPRLRPPGAADVAVGGAAAGEARGARPAPRGSGSMKDEKDEPRRDDSQEERKGLTGISAPFIRRPIATTLLVVAIALAGGLAFRLLPVSPLPQVEFPTIHVGAGLPGASPDTMASSVATPLERQFGRIAGVTEMTSSSSLGSTNITLQFDLNRDIDAASRDVQAAINAARGQLPANLPSNPNLRKSNPSDAPIMLILAHLGPDREAEDLRRGLVRPATEDLADRGGGGDHGRRRRPAGGAGGGQPDPAQRLRAQPGGRPHGAHQRQRQPAEGGDRQRRSPVDAEHQRPAPQGGGIPAAADQVPQRRRRAPLATSRRSTTRSRTSAPAASRTASRPSC